MEIWIAGATGVLARQAVPMLLAAGHTVVGLARDASKWPGAPPAMRFVPCDVTVAGQVIKAFSGEKPDAIINLATSLPSERPKHGYLVAHDLVRREGTRNLAEAALLADAYFVHLSSHFVAAPQGDNWITEDSPFAHTTLMDSAIDAERIVQKALNQGMPGCLLRAATVYSADSTQTKAIVHGLKTGMPILIGSGRNFWSFIHPYDVATAILRVLEARPAGESFCITDDHPEHMGECLTWLAKELHVHPPKAIAPFLAKLAIGGDMVDLMTGSRRVSNAKAKGMLGWTPRYPSYKDGFPGTWI
ncbi:MAG TPA: NAD(P)-dependent oxidoreductase [Armatimonadota bacterium]|jgi:nucleoside-diphosphate-sugar epimerase